MQLTTALPERLQNSLTTGSCTFFFTEFWCVFFGATRRLFFFWVAVLEFNGIFSCYLHEIKMEASQAVDGMADGLSAMTLEKVCVPGLPSLWRCLKCSGLSFAGVPRASHSPIRCLLCVR
jgi:hypothetical protein